MLGRLTLLPELGRLVGVEVPLLLLGRLTLLPELGRLVGVEVPLLLLGRLTLLPELGRLVPVLGRTLELLLPLLAPTLDAPLFVPALLPLPVTELLVLVLGLTVALGAVPLLLVVWGDSGVLPFHPLLAG